MQNPLLVTCLEGLGQVAAPARDPPLLWWPLLPQHFLEIPPFHVFHDQKGLTTASDPDVVDLDASGVIDPGHDRRFPLKAPTLALGLQGGVHQLQGDLSTQLPILGQEHTPHPALTQAAQDLVATEVPHSRFSAPASGELGVDAEFLQQHVHLEGHLSSQPYEAASRGCVDPPSGFGESYSLLQRHATSIEQGRREGGVRNAKGPPA